MKQNPYTRSIITAIACVLLFGSNLSAQSPDNVQCTLISEFDSIKEGQEFDVAIRLNPNPGWHIYWENPGDNGQAPSISWELPEGWTAGDLQFPVPHFVPFQGMMSYGYDASTLFISTIQPSDSFDEVVLKGSVRWLACDDSICLPGSSDVRLTLNKADGAVYSKYRTEFRQARAEHPTKADWNASFHATETNVVLEVHFPEDAEIEDAWFFPANSRLIDHAKPQLIQWDNNKLRIQAPSNSRWDRYEIITGVLQMKSADSNGKGQFVEIEASRIETLADGNFDEGTSRSPLEFLDE